MATSNRSGIRSPRAGYAGSSADHSRNTTIAAGDRSGIHFPGAGDARKLLVWCGLYGYSPRDTVDVLRQTYKEECGGLTVKAAMNIFQKAQHEFEPPLDYMTRELGSGTLDPDVDSMVYFMSRVMDKITMPNFTDKNGCTR